MSMKSVIPTVFSALVALGLRGSVAAVRMRVKIEPKMQHEVQQPKSQPNVKDLVATFREAVDEWGDKFGEEIYKFGEAKPIYQDEDDKDYTGPLTWLADAQNLKNNKELKEKMQKIEQATNALIVLGKGKEALRKEAWRMEPRFHTLDYVIRSMHGCTKGEGCRNPIFENNGHQRYLCANHQCHGTARRFWETRITGKKVETLCQLNPLHMWMFNPKDPNKGQHELDGCKNKTSEQCAIFLRNKMILEPARKLKVDEELGVHATFAWGEKGGHSFFITVARVADGDDGLRFFYGESWLGEGSAPSVLAEQLNKEHLFHPLPSSGDGKFKMFDEPQSNKGNSSGDIKYLEEKLLKWLNYDKKKGVQNLLWKSNVKYNAWDIVSQPKISETSYYKLKEPFTPKTGNKEQVKEE